MFHEGGLRTLLMKRLFRLFRLRFRVCFTTPTSFPVGDCGKKRHHCASIGLASMRFTFAAEQPSSLAI